MNNPPVIASPLPRVRRYRVWSDIKKKMGTAVSIICNDKGIPFAVTARFSKDVEVVSVDSKMVLLEFSGTKDDNGMDVFEGDIIKCKGLNSFGSIQYIQGAVCFCEGHLAFELKTDSDLIPANPQSYGVIVGNIFENPELVPHMNVALEPEPIRK